MPTLDPDACIKCGARCRAGRAGSSGPGTAILEGVVTINVSERQMDTDGDRGDVYDSRRVCGGCAPVMKDALIRAPVLAL